jgi:hypothetical protein
MLTMLDETFADQPDGWPNDPESTGWFAEGAYQMAARWPDRFVAIRAPLLLDSPADDLAISATFRKVGGPRGGGYGIVVGDQADAAGDGLDQGGRYIVAEVGDQGLVGIWRRETDHWVDLVSWTPAAPVHQGSEPNTVTVRLTGRSLSLVVNGTPATGYPDIGLDGGQVGVFVGGDGNEVELQRLVVQTPAGGVAAPTPLASAPALAPDERAYFAYLYARWTDAGEALNAVGSLSELAGRAPTLLLDWAWRQQMLAACATLRRAGSDLQSYPAPASERLEPIQRLAAEIGGDVAYVADEYATLIASRDPLGDGMRHLNRAIERLHKLAPKSTEMRNLLRDLRRVTSP